MSKKNIFKRGIITIILMLLIFTTACQSDGTANKEINNYRLAEGQINKSIKAPSPTTNQTAPEIDRKIIKKANLNLEVENIGKIDKKIIGLITDFNGYIASSRKWQNSNQQNYYSYTLKVPQNNFMNLLQKIKTLGKLKDERITGQDITMEYIDLQARLKNYKSEEVRYLELLEKAQDVEDILKIEKELNRVRRDIERLQGRLNYYDNQTNLSTIDLQLREPERVISTDWKITESFKRAIRGFISSINWIIVLIGTLIPWLIILGIVGIALYKLIRYIRK